MRRLHVFPQSNHKPNVQSDAASVPSVFLQKSCAIGRRKAAAVPPRSPRSSVWRCTQLWWETETQRKQETGERQQRKLAENTVEPSAHLQFEAKLQADTRSCADRSTPSAVFAFPSVTSFSFFFYIHSQQIQTDTRTLSQQDSRGKHWTPNGSNLIELFAYILLG